MGRLALRWGCSTQEVLRRIGSSQELTRLQAVCEIDPPWAEERMEWMLARIASAILNRLRWGEGEKVVEPADLMPDFTGWKAERERQKKIEAEEAKKEGRVQQLTPEEWRARRRGE